MALNQLPLAASVRIRLFQFHRHKRVARQPQRHGRQRLADGQLAAPDVAAGQTSILPLFGRYADRVRHGRSGIAARPELQQFSEVVVQVEPLVLRHHIDNDDTLTPPRMRPTWRRSGSTADPLLGLTNSMTATSVGLVVDQNVRRRPIAICNRGASGLADRRDRLRRPPTV